jgi:2-methylcitrate dehydratase PrpD
MFKLCPSAGSTHAALDAFGALMTRHSIMADSIDAVDVETVDWSVSHGATIYEPVDVIGAQFSLAFSIALLAVTGENRLDDYSNPARWRDPAMLAMARRVTPISAPVPEGGSELFARVRVSLKNGQEFAEYQPAPRGYPSNPAAHDELIRKFRSVTEGILLPSDQDALQNLVDRLENASSLEPLFAILERVSVTA